MPRAMPESCSAFFSSISGFNAVSIWKFTKRSARAATLSRAGPVSCSSASRMTRGRKRILGRGQRSDGRADPAQNAVGAERDVAIAGSGKPLGAAVEFQRQRLLRGGLDRLALLAAGRLVGGESEPLQLPDMVALDQDCAGRANFGFKHRIFSQAAHEDGSPAIYEAFRQPLM